MTQEDKDLLLKDLCARLPYGTKVRRYRYTTPIDSIQSVELLGLEWLKELYEEEAEFKPYLFPLSSMTKEQMEELKELCNMYTPDDDYHPYAHKGIEVLYKHVLDDNYKFSSFFKTDVIDWLNKNHFDYRGLIPIGLANDATDLNIY